MKIENKKQLVTELGVQQISDVINFDDKFVPLN